MKKPIKPLEELLDSVRDIEGFPIGKDEDILGLSDPPYYTVCPNPYINDFIEEYGKPYDEATDDYHCEPFVGDVSEGKKNRIYNIHSYHTKVPHKAIMKFIKHYTKKGDVILDGFAGTGMTAVAAKLSERNVITSDLSPIASFISHNMNNLKIYQNIFSEIINNVANEYNWMFQTKNKNGDKLSINFVVWSECFLCPYCSDEFDFYNTAVNPVTGSVSKKFNCPVCSAEISKKECKKKLDDKYDDILGRKIRVIKVKPVLINYFDEEGGKQFKTPDKYDLDVLSEIEKMKIPYWFPNNRMTEGGESRRNDRTGITHVHHFYIKRVLLTLSKIWNHINKIYDTQTKNSLKFIFTASIMGLSHLQRYRHNSGFPNMILSGTLYIGSVRREWNPINWVQGKFNSVLKASKHLSRPNSFSISKEIVSTQSSTIMNNFPCDSCDYIFTDPPFGNNLSYSELNFIWESWLKVKTNIKDEAIINSSQNKGLHEYNVLLRMAFKEYYRILKPNRWITVVFHNSKSNIWNMIQDAILRAGFIIAQISILDKKQGSYKQITSPGAVKNDLVINAYKPKESFKHRFLELAGEGLEEEFIKMHLSHLKADPTIERTEQMLYSKLLAYYVQRSYAIKYDASTFYKMLHDNFVEEDGYWFNKDQLENYREFKQKMKLEEIDDLKSGQMLLFIDCEKTAIIWLHSFLDSPKGFQTIHPAFTKIANISGDSVPELMELLDKNFVLENGKYRRPQTEDEKMSVTQKRECELQREFDVLLLEAKGSKKKIKVCRKQAVIYGFEQCYKNNRFQDILALGKRLNKKIIENDSEISEFIEVAELKVEGF